MAKDKQLGASNEKLNTKISEAENRVADLKARCLALEKIKTDAKEAYAKAQKEVEGLVLELLDIQGGLKSLKNLQQE